MSQAGQGLAAGCYARMNGYATRIFEKDSLAFAQAIEHRYRELGGEITYDAPVDKILVEHGRAIN